MEGCWILLNGFSVAIEMILCFVFFLALGSSDVVYHRHVRSAACQNSSSISVVLVLSSSDI